MSAHLAAHENCELGVLEGEVVASRREAGECFGTFGEVVGRVRVLEKGASVFYEGRRTISW